MRTLLFAVLLISTAHASDVPFYLRSIDGPRDVSGINENFRSVVGDITKLRADMDDGIVATDTLEASATQYVLRSGDTMTGQLTLANSSFTASGASFTYGVTATTLTATSSVTAVSANINGNATALYYYGSASRLTDIPAAGGAGAVQYSTAGALGGRTDKMVFYETTGTLVIGTTTVAATRGVRISSTIIAELEICNSSPGSNCGTIFSAHSGANAYTTFASEGSLRFNSAGSNRGGFSTSGAMYFGTDPVAAAGVSGDVYASGNVSAAAFIATSPNPGVSTFAGNVSVVGTVSGSTMTTTGGLVLPRFTTVQLQASTPTVVGIMVMGPSPTYDTYVGTGIVNAGQWLNQRTQVGP